MSFSNVWIIIPVHNRKEITITCLNQLKKNGDLTEYSILVVDDGSIDGTSAAIKSLFPEVIILEGNGNLWWTGAIRKGMEYAYNQGANYLIWLNDDCQVPPQCIKKIMNFCSENQNRIIGCQGYDEQKQIIISFGGKRKKKLLSYQLINCPENKILECDLLSGNFVCMSTNIIDKIGYPNNKTLPHYGGDSEFLIRARKSGYKIYVINFPGVLNFSGQARIAPQKWLFQEGDPLDIWHLVFTPQSFLYWKLWFTLAIKEYGKTKGVLFFLLYYSRYFLIPILIITPLRFLPLQIRYKISNFKRLMFR